MYDSRSAPDSHAMTIARTTPKMVDDYITTSTLNGLLIYFAGFKSHIGIYPMTTTIRKQFKKELSPYLSGKGTAKFPFDELIPYPLIQQIVKFRVEEQLTRSRPTET